MTAASGQTISGLNFGEFQTVTLTGEVYNDLNGDGSIAGGEPGLSGWTVSLLSGSNQVVATATTDAGGGFSFPGLGPGTYTVQEIIASGYVQTSAPSPVRTQGGRDVSGLNLGNFQEATVAGEVFEDTNQDGSLDNGEAGLSCWTVQLLDGTGQVVASTRTDAQGLYAFTGLVPGTYTIADVLQIGYIQTAPAAGNYSFTPASGQQATGEDFGIFKAVALAVTGLATTPGQPVFGLGCRALVERRQHRHAPRRRFVHRRGHHHQHDDGAGAHHRERPLRRDRPRQPRRRRSAPRQYAFHLPAGDPGVGQIQIVVTADVFNNVSTRQEPRQDHDVDGDLGPGTLSRPPGDEPGRQPGDGPARGVGRDPELERRQHGRRHGDRPIL